MCASCGPNLCRAWIMVSLCGDLMNVFMLLTNSLNRKNRTFPLGTPPRFAQRLPKSPCRPDTLSSNKAMVKMSRNKANIISIWIISKAPNSSSTSVPCSVCSKPPKPMQIIERNSNWVVASMTFNAGALKGQNMPWKNSEANITLCSNISWRFGKFGAITGGKDSKTPRDKATRPNQDRLGLKSSTKKLMAVWPCTDQVGPFQAATKQKAKNAMQKSSSKVPVISIAIWPSDQQIMLVCFKRLSKPFGWE